MTLTKADLADLLFEQVGLNKREAKDMVEAFFEEIRTSLEDGDSVKLSGFGNFELRQKSERPGRNPKTGEEIPITARRVVTARADDQRRTSRTAHIRTDIQNGHSLLFGECCGFRCSPQRNESDRSLGEDLVRKLFECIGCNTTVALEGRDQWNMDSGQVNSSRSHRTQPHRTNLVGLVRISIVERKLS